MNDFVKENLLIKAVEIAGKNYSRNEIFEILKNGEEFEKPVAILNLNEIESKEEAKLLIEHLTGVDGRIREACANKISEFLQNVKFSSYFLTEESVKVILDGIMDINPNVGRVLIEGVGANLSLQKMILEPLINRVKEKINALKTLSNTPFRENKLNDRKNHAKNKIVFNLYWGMECLKYINFEEKMAEMLEILEFAAFYPDYTIREKAAGILLQIKEPPKELLQKLKNDENFYVKNQLL